MQNEQMETPNPRPKSPSQGLQEARALVAAGWCQGPYHVVNDDGSESHCAIGAVMRVCKLTGDPWHYGNLLDRKLFKEMNGLLDEAARRRTRRPDMTAIGYNEARGRTQKQVLRLFDDALTEATK